MLARRPWIHWAVVAVAATGAAATTLERVDALDAARRSWGETTTVYTAAVALEPGDEVAYTALEMPRALVGAHVAGEDQVVGAIARQRVARGEVIAAVDVTTRAGATALIPDGWLGVPVVESPVSGAGVGDRVMVASDGVVLTDEAIVIGRLDGVALVAVAADVAPLLTAVADAGGLTLLLAP